MMNYKYHKRLAFQPLIGYIFQELEIKIETHFS